MGQFILDVVISIIYIAIFNQIIKRTVSVTKNIHVDVKYFYGYLFTLMYSILFALGFYGGYISFFTFEIIIIASLIVASLTTLYAGVLILLRLFNFKIYKKLIKPLED